MTSIEKLKADFANFNGQPFKHFFCPMLYTDADVELCHGHVVNRDFPNAPIPRATVIQRKDIDNFYAHFESEFVKLQYEGTPIQRVLSDDGLRRKLKPEISLNNEAYDFYPVNKNNKSKAHSLIAFSHDRDKIFGLKLNPSEKDKLSADGWEVKWGANLTTDAIPSLIKAAHLSLFYIAGYGYTFTNAAKFVGKSILGRFFLENRHKTRDAIRQAGELFFADYREMIRPVKKISGDWSFNGTANDGKILLCRSPKQIIWGGIVFVNLGTKTPLQAVFMPLEDLDNRAESAILFSRFLQGEIRQFEVTLSTLRTSEWESVDAWQTMNWTAG